MFVFEGDVFFYGRRVVFGFEEGVCELGDFELEEAFGRFLVRVRVGVGGFRLVRV